MSDLDPLARANILARFGRTKEAIASLQTAVESDTSNAELQAKLKELLAEHPTSSKQRATIAIHLTMSWVLLCSSFLLVFFPFYHLARLQTSSFSAPSFGGLALLLVVGGALVGLVVLVYVALHLFLRCWFFYLKNVVGANAELVERRLPSVLNVSVLEPQYSRVRRQFFPMKSDA